MRLLVIFSLLALASCSVVPNSVHQGQSIGFEGMLYDSLDVETTVSGSTSTANVDDASSFGIRYEAFNSESTSILFGLTSREYDLADATELSIGARMYTSPDASLQPFFQGTFAGSSGWDIGGITSDTYFSAGIGAGVAWFFSPNSSAEVGLRYDTFVVAPEWTDTGVLTEQDISGTSGWFGISFYF